MNAGMRRSPLALAVLALLFEEPMHPYRMQVLIRERGKDEVVNVRQRTGLYRTIERLLAAGLVRVRETERDSARPERTVYELTAEGREVAADWLRAALSTPGQEFPEFPAAVSFIGLLSPDDVLRQLQRRQVLLRQELARIEAGLTEAGAMLPRVFLLESEYLRAVTGAEINWVDGLIDDLRAKQLTWDTDELVAGFGDGGLQP
jgi:DNA-binding PadR family transcriptional regulator